MQGSMTISRALKRAPVAQCRRIDERETGPLPLENFIKTDPVYVQPT